MGAGTGRRGIRVARSLARPPSAHGEGGIPARPLLPVPVAFDRRQATRVIEHPEGFALLNAAFARALARRSSGLRDGAVDPRAAPALTDGALGELPSGSSPHWTTASGRRARARGRRPASRVPPSWAWHTEVPYRRAARLVVRRSSASWPRTPPRARWRPGPGYGDAVPDAARAGVAGGRAAVRATRPRPAIRWSQPLCPVAGGACGPGAPCPSSPISASARPSLRMRRST